ncbi:hypothetical protein KUTeg_008469 [Tegillarca granosa]|uniref:WxxW domain-containing protein n=1 Tax=Tegillarca granosa TaxID=220873 RepID=A0ABQ9F969_TEGGR|nr:hypothetical protein KUTeg_008469 [Tegillarca granosa]
MKNRKLRKWNSLVYYKHLEVLCDSVSPTLTPGKCTQSFWGPWINQHSPVNGTDFEYLSASELSQFCVNGKITKINCYTDDPLMSVSSDRTGETSTCRLETGFLCRNIDNYPYKCSDYKIRYFCECQETSGPTPRPTPQPTPGPTFSVQKNYTGPRCGWSSWLNSHTPTAGKDGGEFETIAGLKSKYGLCSSIQKIKCRRVGGVPPPLGETRPVVCDEINGFACYNKDQPSQSCYDYEVMVKCWDEMCEPGHTSASPSEHTMTTAKPLYPHPKCHWTYWINVDSPLTGTGDSETISVIRSKNSFCENPTNIECRATTTKQEALSMGQKVTCDLTTGLKCLNWENGGHCNDYEVRFYCPCASKLNLLFVKSA